MKKLNREEAIKILKEYIPEKLVKLEWFKKIKKNVKAIVFYGSTAKGLNRPDSDLDILIFVPLAIEERYTKGEYFYKFNGREINIVIRSIERLRRLGKRQDDKKLGDGQHKRGLWEKNDSRRSGRMGNRRQGEEEDNVFEAEVFSKCEVLHETDREARRLIEKIRAKNN